MIIYKQITMEHIFKLFEFNIYNDKEDKESDDDSGVMVNKDNGRFMIQMFGINEQGERASIIVEDYQPFFYVKVDNNWGQTKKTAFYNHLKAKIGKYYENSITSCKLIERKKLYGFDAGLKHRFIELKFANIPVYNKVKNLWYTDGKNDDGEDERRLLKNGYVFDNTCIELYEANIPPLLRFFHLREISPSGWVALPVKKTIEITGINKKTSCDKEFLIHYKNIIPLNDKESRVPYKIMSFDIEASSSHGDFPVPIKSYKKLATNIVDYFEKMNSDISRDSCISMLKDIIKSAFGFKKMDGIDLVYPKEAITNETNLVSRTENWLKTKVRDCKNNDEEHLIESLFENANKEFMKTTEKDDNDNESDTDNESDNGEQILEEPKYFNFGTTIKTTYKNKESTIVDIICDNKFDREGKINELIRTLRNNFPALEGDKVTFIGSTFMKYGDIDPYLNHCIVLNSCDKLDGSVNNSHIETYATEKDVLTAWTKLVQRENPDVIIGYNIFGFDYEFMFRRSQELFCVEDFLKLSRNNDEMCCTKDYKNRH